MFRVGGNGSGRPNRAFGGEGVDGEMAVGYPTHPPYTCGALLPGSKGHNSWAPD